MDWIRRLPILLLAMLVCLGSESMAGARRALLVGIDRYAAKPAIQDLVGATKDVEAMAQLLERRQGFHVIPLVNEQATLQRFLTELKLLTTSCSPDDVVLVFFAGYASEIFSTNGEEPDGKDQTLVFHDSRTGNVPDLTDDRLNEALAPLAQRAAHLVLVFDCGGQMPRGLTRYLNADPSPGRTARSNLGLGTKRAENLVNTVLLSASAKSAAAEETTQGGRFTQALVQAWSEADAQTHTYLEHMAIIRDKLRRYNQVPHCEGLQNNFLFSPGALANPLIWTVESVSEGTDPTITVGGNLLLAGIGKDALLAIFDARLDPDDPKLEDAKAEAVVIDYATFKARAKLTRQRSQGLLVKPGDRAMVLRPSKQGLVLRVATSGNLRPKDLAELKAELGRTPHAFQVQWVDRVEEAEVILDRQENQWVLLSKQGQLRVESTETGAARIREMTAALVRLARASALARIAETKAQIPRDALVVRLVPSPFKAEQTPVYPWTPDPANQAQTVPLHQNFHLKVMLSVQKPPMSIGALLVTRTGHLKCIPSTRLATPLDTGASVTFDSIEDMMVAKTPEVIEQIFVFGTRQPMEWARLCDSELQARGQPADALILELLNYEGGARGEPSAWDDRDWVVTVLDVKVNARKP